VTTATHCPYCALQCAMTITAGDHGPAVSPRDFPTNRGGLCQKGWTSAELLTTPDRITAPLLRDRASGRQCTATWDAALDHVVATITRLQREHGTDAVAVFGSGALTNEKAYLLGKFARVALRTSQIDYNGRFCMSSAAAAGNRAFGLDRGLPFPVADLGQADLVVLAGANPAETMPPLMGHLAGGVGRLIVIDPRRTPTALAALKGAGLHLQPAPGTDLALALGLLHIAQTGGYLDTPDRMAYRRQRTAGWEQAWQHACAWWPERAERVTGVPVADMRAAVQMLHAANEARAGGTGGGAYILTGRGVEQHSKGTDTASAWINLALAFGLPGTPGNGYGCLTGQGNGQGGREHGQKADQLPGYRSISDPKARAHIAGVWNIPEPDIPGPGFSATELLDSIGRDGGPRALLVFGANLAVSAPRARRVTEQLRRLDLLVVADSVPSETAQLADVVLPVAQWAEERGTMTSLEGRILRRRRAVSPPQGVWTDLEVLSALAARLGREAKEFPADPDAVLAELREASRGGPADYSGADVERLDSEVPLYWPVPGGAGLAGPNGTPRLFLDRFAHPDGRARYLPAGYRDAAELPDGEFPLFGTTGRVLQHYQSGAQTRRVPELHHAQPEMFVEVHPDTARRAGLADGVQARVRSRRGTVMARVRCVPRMRTDTVFLPFHFPGEGAANALTNPALDPVSRMPEFKVCAVRLEPVSQRRGAAVHELRAGDTA
jgi:assimilatory nitrate reductase catalytic subunit